MVEKKSLIILKAEAKISPVKIVSTSQRYPQTIVELYKNYSLQVMKLIKAIFFFSLFFSWNIIFFIIKQCFRLCKILELYWLQLLFGNKLYPLYQQSKHSWVDLKRLLMVGVRYTSLLMKAINLLPQMGSH